MKANVNHISKPYTSQTGHNVQNTSEKESVKNSTEKSTNLASDDGHQSVVATPNDRHISKSDTSQKGHDVQKHLKKNQ